MGNTFGTEADLSVSFVPYGGEASDECYESSLNDGESFVASDMRALCVDGLARVSVFATAISGEIPGAQNTVSTCSNDPVDCAHTFVLPCLDRRCDESGRRLGSTTYYSEESLELVSENPSKLPNDITGCSSEDFPCEGEGTQMVLVCHYSPLKGYQTFCVPEIDSEILHFYDHDFCGPCEGAGKEFLRTEF